MIKYPFKQLLPAIPLLLAISGCGPASFPAARLPQAVKELCKKEHKLDVDASLVGKTLYLSCSLDGLIGLDLDFNKEALETLEGVMLSGTRAALSTDAQVDFLVIKVKDSRLGSTITLLRYVPDIKGLIYMRYSRADFEDRLCLETNSAEESTPQDMWHDIDLPEYVARLISSQLHRQLTGNPLVSVFARIDRLVGSVGDGVLVLDMKRGGSEHLSDSITLVLHSAIEEISKDVLKKYDPDHTLIHTVRLVENAGPTLWELGFSK